LLDFFVFVFVLFSLVTAFV
jgi:hypothetical protein